MIFNQAFDALDREAAVVRNVGGLGCPGRHGTQARADHDTSAVIGAGIGVAVVQQRRKFDPERFVRQHIADHQMHKPGSNA